MNELSDKVDKRIYSLDVLKIIATICIVFHHYQIYTKTTFMHVNFAGGNIRFEFLVELFFVLSGCFVFEYIDKINNGMTFSDFFVPKYVRFLLPRSITVIVFAVLCILYENLYQDSFFDRSPSILNVAQAALGFSTGWGLSLSKMNGTVWYISVLLICYILFYFSTWVAHLLKTNVFWIFAFWIILGFSITTNNIDILFLNAWTARGITSFFWGLIFWKYCKNGVSWKVALISFVMFLVVCFSVIHYRLTYAAQGLSYIYTYALYPPLIILMRTKLVEEMFSYRWIGTLSKISFEAYIWHFPLILLVLDVDKYFGLNLVYENRFLQIGVAGFSFVIGALCYNTIEIPGARWLMKLWRNECVDN